MRTVALTKTLAAASANNICASQALAAPGSLTLNGSTVVNASGTAGTLGYIPKQAVLDTQRRILFTPAGAEAGKVATIVGTNDSGAIISEQVTLVNNPSTVASVLDYKTILSISFTVALASTITVGTNATGSTPWVSVNHNLTPINIAVQTELTSSVTYQGETTLDDFFTAISNAGMVNLTPGVNVNTAIASGTTAQATSITNACRGVRFTITSGTGTLAAQVEQAGIING